MPVDAVSAAIARAPLLRAARVYEAQLVAGVDCEESEEAEAGAVLLAEATADITDMAAIARAWMKANRKT